MEKQEKIKELYFEYKYNQKEISEILGISNKYVSKVLLKDSRYKEEKEKHPVRLGTDTYETKSGTEAVSGLYEVYEKMLDDLSSLSGDKDKFTYTKLIYNNEIADKIAAYKAALICTSEETNNNGN